MADWGMNGDVTLHALRAQAQYAVQALAEMERQRDALLSALKGVVRVADRKTVEFDAARAAIAAAEGK